ncbi:MAG: ribosome small subunit-dependent GTPase A [Casimicrobiaceae bacterium]
MLEFNHEALSALGMTPALARHAMLLETVSDAGDGPPRLSRIIEVHRDSVMVHDGHEAGVARVRPRLIHVLQEEDLALGVGDWVVVVVDRHGDGWVSHRLPPSSHIARRDADGRSHTVVSNVDVAMVVMGLDDDFNPRRLERFLAVVRDDSIVKVAVLTKADTLASHTVEARVALLSTRLPSGLPIMAVNAMATATVDALGDYLRPGWTLVMLGSSGAGKSTLTNTLLGAKVQDTGAVRASDGRGMHTTTSRSLHLLPCGACVIDTPGLRTLRPDGDEASLARSFSDIDALARGCRFRDCRHDDEPGCAVRAGVDADRLDNYHKLLREMRRDTLTALDRRRQVAQWKVRGRATKARMKQKRGGESPW